MSPHLGPGRRANAPTAQTFVSSPAGWRGRVIGHRGASAERPENTLAAFDEAVRQGCDGIETDVRLTRDGVPVLVHDPTLARLGGGRRRVSAVTFDDLRRLDAGAWFDPRFSGERIPVLDEVLERYGGSTRLLLELKTETGPAGAARDLQLVRATVDRIHRLRLETRVAILCFDAAVLRAVGEVAPELARALNVRPPPVLPRRLAALLPSLHAVSVDIVTLTPGFAAAVKRAGRSLFAYTCNSERHVHKAVAAGVDAIMSDRPGWLAGVLGEGRRP